MDYANSLRLLVVGTAFVISSCALIDTYVVAPGVSIERIQTRKARIVSASLWEDRSGIYLRGKVIPMAMNKMPLYGHIDVSITPPSGSSTTCITARHRNLPRRVSRPYFVRIGNLPEAGSVVRVWHHHNAIHDGCVS